MRHGRQSGMALHRRQSGMALHRRQSGMALIIVLFFALLLTSSIATFMRRAAVDRMIVVNRDKSRQAESLARGGLQLARALLLEDRLLEQGSEFRVETHSDLWALASQATIPAGEDAALQLQILDSGSRLNLNGLFANGALRDDRSPLLLEALLEKTIAEMPGRPEDKLYDPLELTRNLIDFVDEDEDRWGTGGLEDDFYQNQDPPYRAANRPLLSLDELRLVEGFDGPLVDALLPYLTVHPYAGADGINLNTAPPHVLSLLYYGVADDYRLADVELVADVLEVREGGGMLCDDEATHETCTPLGEVITGEIYPPPTWTGDVFTVLSRASVGEITRTVEAVIDRTDVNNPTLLAWRVH